MHYLTVTMFLTNLFETCTSLYSSNPSHTVLYNCQHSCFSCQVREMVPGTRPAKKKKAGAFAALTNQPQTPSRMTRSQALMPSSAGRPPPRERLPLPTKNNSKPIPKPTAIRSATQLQAQLSASDSQTRTTETTSTVPSNLQNTRLIPTMSAPITSTMPSPNLTNASAACSEPVANPVISASSVPRATSGHTTTLAREPTPTISVTQPALNDTSPGGQSSRQSNDINEFADQVDAANSEGHNTEGQQDDTDLVPGEHIVQALFPATHIYSGYCYMNTLLLLFAIAVRRREPRKKTIGLGLERLVRKGNKLPIQVAEGKKRPDIPLQAAKLASETGVAVRDQLPIYTSWKLYEKDQGPVEVQKVLDKVAVRNFLKPNTFLYSCTPMHNLVSINSFVWL
jgi:hypothetical protein